ncbi:MAG: hypothetical protein R3C28_00595 [Pirellulaceae bacterium]
MNSGEIILAEAIERRSAQPTSSWLSTLVDAVAGQVTDRLNPILVKEARQALKSRQFVVTFTLLLIAAWVWTLFEVSMNMPGVYYTPLGGELMLGYYFILAVPMLVIVPFTSFRSLASEQEDGTYELLSITSLSSRQIVTGKLASAILQMVVYYSALAPCLAFTYLLRGIDVATICLLLFYTFLASVLFSAVGLVFAGFSTQRTWNAMVSVLLLLALAFGTFGWLVFLVDELYDALARVPLDAPEFWIGNLVAVTAYISYLVLFVQVAAAQNSFASDNKSTRIRVTLLVQAACYVGWIGFAFAQFGYEPGIPVVAAFYAAFHWMIYGAYLCNEGDIVSPRVKRSLPQSFLGRTLLTWFNPGSGTGYLFAVATFGTIVAAFTMIGMVVEVMGYQQRWGPRLDELVWGLAFLLAYYVAYLGAGRILLRMIPAWQREIFLVPILLYLVLLVLGIVIPMGIDAAVSRNSNLDYSALHSSNWAWTLNEVLDSSVPVATYVLVLGSAALIFLVNLILATREIEAVRIATPQRILDEDRSPATDT